MSRIPEDRPTAVTLEYLPQDQFTMAIVEWPFAQPESTYTIDVTPDISLEMDRRFPIRPSRIILLDDPENASVAMLDRLVGEELAAAMCVAHLIGPGMLRLTLTDANRAAIAELQQQSPSTPTLLKRACGFILDSAALKYRDT